MWGGNGRFWLNWELIKAHNDHLPDPNKADEEQAKAFPPTSSASEPSDLYMLHPDHGDAPVKVDFTRAFRTGGVFLSCVQQANEVIPQLLSFVS